MKVYIKLLIFLTLLLCVFGMLAYGMMQSAKRAALSAQVQLEQREGEVIENIIDLKRSSMHTFAWDYSWWQDMIDWMPDRDEEWLQDQFDQVLYTYDVEFFAIYDSTGALISPVLGADLTVSDVELPAQLSQQVLQRPHSQLYEASFENREKGMLELYYAPVMPQEDEARAGKHYGYLVVGRFWDAAYLKSIESITGATMEIVGADVNEGQDGDEGWTGIIRLERPFHDLAGQLQGRLIMTKFLPVADQIITKQAQIFWLMMSLSALAVFSLVVFVLWSVTRPLQHLSYALETGDTERIANLTYGKSEFKRLSQLIIDNNEQRERLENEVARRRHTEDALMQSRDLAESASRAKSQFLANMSHETRTPLHTISGYASLLEDSELDEEQQESVSFIRQSSDRLVQMLTDIIELSSLEADQMHPQNSRFVLAELLDELVAAVRSGCGDKPIDLKFEFCDTCPETIYTDYERLRHLLLNLIDNAVKFTDAGVIAFRCHGAPEEGAYRLCFEVEDSGIGIRKEELASIFEAFYLIDDSDSREYQGAGLGLAIVKRLSAIIGARIEAESNPGEGSVFRVVLVLSENDDLVEQGKVSSGTV